MVVQISSKGHKLSQLMRLWYLSHRRPANAIHVIFNDLDVNSQYCNLSCTLPPDQQYLTISPDMKKILAKVFLRSRNFLVYQYWIKANYPKQ